MPVFVHILANEDSNVLRDALTRPTPNEDIARAFTYVERGTFGEPPHSRTALNGGWAGVLAVARNADGTAEAQRTWALTDAQAAASGIVTNADVQAFAQRLADDVHQSLRDRASRNRGGQIGDFWRVVARPSVPDAAPVAVESSRIGWLALLAAAAIGAGVVLYRGGK